MVNISQKVGTFLLWDNAHFLRKIYNEYKLNGERLNVFSPKIKNKQDYQLLPLLSNIRLEFLTSAIKQIKGVSMQIGKEEIKLFCFFNIYT